MPEVQVENEDELIPRPPSTPGFRLGPSSNRARGSSQARLVVGEFFPDFLGLLAAADKPFGGIVGVASHEIPHSHLNRGNGSANDVAKRQHIWVALRRDPPSVPEVQVENENELIPRPPST